LNSNFAIKLILNIIFYPLFVAITIAAVPVITVALVFSSLGRPLRVRIRHLRYAINIYGKIITRLPYPFCVLDVQDETGLDLLAGPFLFIFNHRSSSDPFLLSTIPVKCESIQVVNKWPFKLPILGPAAAYAGYLSVNDMSSEEFLMACEAELAQDVSIAFYPEGTRSGGKHMNKFHSTAFRVFLKTGIPIIPICVAGNENMPHKGSLVLNPGKVKVKFLRPLLREEFAEDTSAYEVKNLLWNRMNEELMEMDAAL
jgi:1-acyl-sn-glycerol-3-phosphate acyltransferase